MFKRKRNRRVREIFAYCVWIASKVSLKSSNPPPIPYWNLGANYICVRQFRRTVLSTSARTNPHKVTSRIWDAIPAVQIIPPGGEGAKTERSDLHSVTNLSKNEDSTLLVRQSTFRFPLGQHERPYGRQCRYFHAF